LRVFADEELGRELSVAGVAAVDVSGGVLEEVRVNIDFTASRGCGFDDVLNELEAHNQDISGGRILGDSEPRRGLDGFKSCRNGNLV